MWGQLLESLDERTRKDLDAVMLTRRYKKGALLFLEGEPGRQMAILEKGHLLAERVTLEGDTVVVAVISPGSVFGELALLGDERRSATVKSLTDTEVRWLPGDAFARLRQTHPPLDALLTGLLNARVQRLTMLLVEARHSPVESRIRRVLSELAPQFDNNIPLTQATIATMTGATRPTVNALLQQLQAEGTIEVKRGRLLVLRPEML